MARNVLDQSQCLKDARIALRVVEKDSGNRRLVVSQVEKMITLLRKAGGGRKYVYDLGIEKYQKVG
jgi:hypothetical protein